jgi:hypothetical protein
MWLGMIRLALEAQSLEKVSWRQTSHEMGKRKIPKSSY